LFSQVKAIGEFQNILTPYQVVVSEFWTPVAIAPSFIKLSTQGNKHLPCYKAAVIQIHNFSLSKQKSNQGLVNSIYIYIALPNLIKFGWRIATFTSNKSLWPNENYKTK